MKTLNYIVLTLVIVGALNWLLVGLFEFNLVDSIFGELSLLSRIILASTKQSEWILDPFCGSSTTGIAANLLGRRFLGIDQEKNFVEMSKCRREELEDPQTFRKYCSKIKDIQSLDSNTPLLSESCENILYGDLPF